MHHSFGGNRHNIQGSIGQLLDQFWYTMGPKMVLDSVASNDVSFSENHAFYCFLVHEGSLTMNMQSSPQRSNSKQLGPVVWCFLTGSSCYVIDTKFGEPRYPYRVKLLHKPNWPAPKIIMLLKPRLPWKCLVIVQKPFSQQETVHENKWHSIIQTLYHQPNN